jgi:cysteine synthase A
MKIYNSILEAIGNTPLVKINKLSNNNSANILVKCEYLNPSGSIKDRIALRMIQGAESSGKIKDKNATIVEASTGNTAIAISFVCAVKGYRAVVFMPKGWATKDRTRILSCYGANIVEVELEKEIEAEIKGKSVHGGIVELLPRIKCLEMEKQDTKIWWARQALNRDNILAHRETTGREIIEQTEGKVDALVCSVGTGGTLLGVSEALLKVNPNLEIYAVEPASSSLLKLAPEIKLYMKKYNIPGISGWIISEIEKRKILTEVHLVKDKDAIQTAHLLAKKEGLFCGMSSGANFFIAKKIANELGKGKNVVTILPDSRDRYFETEHFTT